MAALLGQRLETDGVRLHVGLKVTRVERAPGGRSIRVTATPAGLAAQFHLQQRMVAGIAATYEAFNFIQRVRSDAAAQPIDASLAEIANGPAGLGTAHRDLARRLNDQLVGDLEPTPSIVAGVDGPCRAIDAALDRLRDVQTKNSGSSQLGTWNPPAAPACGH